ncbi:MAG: Asp-tRNA(Asn)/Glu-tRNA(Gln) amidotransferase subunit GatC [Candidatus Margulisbacteria bacterium]|jgi:aspartyl-tRNA(Asn)/glutamyl-tRNA(Gln) amidotransferase subunit C|nr:Asp-tRNA(Asn)/Glu-tRNA(Gln) amidotransferase subunit GatC [Candidatus Margulisiibacteriota bacterium]
MRIDVDHVARLARLGLTEAEKKLFADQLAAILDLAASLQKLDTETVPPTAHAIPMKNVLREDKASPCTDVEAIMANGPVIEDHMFKVPRIIEG